MPLWLIQYYLLAIAIFNLVLLMRRMSIEKLTLKSLIGFFFFGL